MTNTGNKDVTVKKRRSRLLLRLELECCARCSYLSWPRVSLLWVLIATGAPHSTRHLQSEQAEDRGIRLGIAARTNLHALLSHRRTNLRKDNQTGVWWYDYTALKQRIDRTNSGADR
jgi:hypothetical protein